MRLLFCTFLSNFFDSIVMDSNSVRGNPSYNIAKYLLSMLVEWVLKFFIPNNAA